MKFLLDVCLSSAALVQLLKDAGHEPISAFALNPSADDAELLETARIQEMVLVTEDRDFGELVVVHEIPHGPIIRLVRMSVRQYCRAMQEVLSAHADELQGSVLLTVSRGGIRIRRETHD